jgi:diguanylate cyclase (GGDEF)-like protein
MTQPIRILLIEDNPGDAILLRETLRDVGGADQFALTHVMRLDEGLEQLASAPFDVVLLDLSLPDGHGLETLSRTHSHASGTPIVVLTGLNDETLAVRAVQEGAQDYLVKGEVDSNLLARSLRYAIERQRMIAQLKRAREQERHMANHDALTGLPNRQLFYDRLGQAIVHSHGEEESVAVLFLDLDDFKTLNDSLGHDAGDQLLKTVAERVRGCIRDTDTAARLGGDEFTFILYRVEHPEDPAVVAQAILDAVAEPIVVNAHHLYVTGSIGISVFPEDGSDIETIVRNADMAMYRAKAAGRNTYQFYMPSMTDRAMERLEMEKQLRAALERDEIWLQYQPQVEVRSGRITGMEALARWRQPGGELVEPARFVALAEETGLIFPLGERVLRMACTQARAWQSAGLPPVRMAVNLSPHQLQRRPKGRLGGYDPVAMVSKVIEESQFDPQWLQIEITESVFLKDPDFAIETLGRLEEVGVSIAIDDFGIGYSSLNYLKVLPASTLKIDRSFVRTVGRQPRDTAIAAAIVALAHNLSLKTVAEGVETVDQWEALRRLGCDEMQGYLFSEPLNANEATALLAENLRKSA